MPVISKSPFLSIITPVYNGNATGESYLKAIFSSTYKDFELIIVDDGSTEDFSKLLKDYPVVIKHLDQRRGSYYARNQGVEMAKGEVVLFLDADITVQPDTLENIVTVLANHPEIAGLICSYDDAPQEKNIVSQFKFLYHYYTHQQENEYVGSFWTGCGAIRKNIFKEMKGFDAGLFQNLNSVNDIDFGYRLRLSHYKIYNAKHIQVKHLKKLTFMEWVYTDIFNRGLPWMKIMLRYRSFQPTLNVNSANLLNIIFVWLMLTVSLLGCMNKGVLVLLPLLLGVFLIGNYKLLKFFLIKRGFLFMTASIPLLFIYYFNCGLCVLLGFVLHNKL